VSPGATVIAFILIFLRAYNLRYLCQTTPLRDNEYLVNSSLSCAKSPNLFKMRKTQSQRASGDLIIDFASTREIESFRRTQCYETQINALTLENAKLNEEHKSLKNDMVALSHECGELELECSREERTRAT
jgi:hypothetical protein